jgi:hypothetical protein
MDNSISDDDARAMETYLASKWGMLSELDPKHPSYVAPPPNMDAPIAGFPVDGVKAWFEASQFKARGEKISSWNSSTKDGKYILQNVSNNENSFPIVKTSGLNRLSTLIFNAEYNMGLNRGLTANSYTLAFVARQTGNRNNRLIGGKGNKLLGYWGGKKNVLHLESWVSQHDRPSPGSEIAKPSDREWDLIVITRNVNKTTYSRNGTVLFENRDGGTGFDGLQINQVDAGDGEVAEILVWNRFLEKDKITVLETYLAKKWGLQSMLDTNHPAFVAPPPNADAPIEGFPIVVIQLWTDASDLKVKDSEKKQSIPNVKFVRVSGGRDYLHFSQVVATNTAGVNVAKGGKTTSSAVGWDTTNARPVDGDERVRNHPQQVHLHQNAWWQVELASPADLASVTIYNRGDCCKERLIGYKITFLDANNNVLYKSPALTRDDIQKFVVANTVSTHGSELAVWNGKTKDGKYFFTSDSPPTIEEKGKKMQVCLKIQCGKISI